MLNPKQYQKIGGEIQKARESKRKREFKTEDAAAFNKSGDEVMNEPPKHRQRFRKDRGRKEDTPQTHTQKIYIVQENIKGEKRV